MYLINDPEIPLLGKYPREVKTYVHAKTYTHMFLVANKWGQPKFPSANGGINQMWSIPTMEYYSAINRNAVLTPAPTGMSSENM